MKKILTNLTVAFAMLCWLLPLPTAAAGDCQMVMGKAADIQTKLNAAKDRHTKVYDQMKQQFSTIRSKLDSKGYDLSAFKNDSIGFENAESRFSSDYADLIIKLTAAVNSCHDGTHFTANLTAARAALTAVRQDQADLHNLYLNNLRPDLLRLRSGGNSGA